MTLHEYLTQSGVSATEFGAKIGVSEATVSRIRKGRQNITRDLMREIILASGGKVTAEDLLFVAKDREAA